MPPRRWAVLGLVALAGCGKPTPVAPPQVVIEKPKPTAPPKETQPSMPMPKSLGEVLAVMPRAADEPASTPEPSGPSFADGPGGDKLAGYLTAPRTARQSNTPLPLSKLKLPVPRALDSEAGLFRRIEAPDRPIGAAPSLGAMSTPGHPPERFAGDFPGSPLPIVDPRFPDTPRLPASHRPREAGQIPRLATGPQPDRPSLDDPSLPASHKAMANPKLPFRTESAPFTKDDVPDPQEFEGTMRLKGLPGDEPGRGTPAPIPHKLK